MIGVIQGMRRSGPMRNQGSQRGNSSPFGGQRSWPEGFRDEIRNRFLTNLRVYGRIGLYGVGDLAYPVGGRMAILARPAVSGGDLGEEMGTRDGRKNRPERAELLTGWKKLVG